MTPAAWREAVSFLRDNYSLSERRGCRSVGSDRSSCRYQARRREPVELIERILALAAAKPRYGYRRLALLLRREGHPVNVKGVLRLYRQLGLSVQRRNRKRASAQARRPAAFPMRANERWSMDFVADSRSDGRAIRLLTIVDDFTREGPVIEVGASLTGQHVVAVLERLSFPPGFPSRIVVDSGTELTSMALGQWAWSRGVELHFIRPGRPVENCYIESFAGRLRDECLNQSWFESLEDARRIVEAWRKEYNGERPHCALGSLRPANSGSLSHDRQTARMGRKEWLRDWGHVSLRVKLEASSR